MVSRRPDQLRWRRL